MTPISWPLTSIPMLWHTCKHTLNTENIISKRSRNHPRRSRLFPGRTCNVFLIFLATGPTRIQKKKDFSSKEIVSENVKVTSLRFRLDVRCWQENPLPRLGGCRAPLHRAADQGVSVEVTPGTVSLTQKLLL